MINTCRGCGAYLVDKEIDDARSEAICPECGHRHALLRLPLLVVSGASGCGKTTVCHLVTPALRDVAVVLDGDVLWGSHFEREDGPSFFETWLRMCKNIAQSGRPVVLFGAGFGPPQTFAGCVERRYIGAIHYLALTCERAEQARRLRARPSWRGSAADTYLEDHADFNTWFREEGPSQEPPVTLIDTTLESVEQTAERVVVWAKSILQADRPGAATGGSSG